MRINVYNYPDELDPNYSGEVTRVGHFESDKADRWTDRDWNGSGGTGRGQAVWRTSGGKWVLEHWSAWQGESGRYQYISEEQAREWLLSNDEDDAVKKYLGEVPEEEDRRPGRPVTVGGEPVNIRLGELLNPVDDWADQHGIPSRAEAIRHLLRAALATEQPYTVTIRDTATGLRETDSRHATLGAAVEELRKVQAGDRKRQQERGLPSWQPRVEHDGRPVDVEAHED